MKRKKKKGKKKSSHPLCMEAIETFGYYDAVVFAYRNFSEDGLYILPNGKLLSTGGLHSDIDEVYEDFEDEIDYIPSYREDYIKRCNVVRVGWYFLSDDDETKFYAEAFHKPTEQQVEKLVKLFKNRDNPRGYFEKTETECDMEIDRPLDVQRWITRCWG